MNGQAQPGMSCGRAVAIGLGVAVLVGLYLSSVYNYLLFHSLAEMFSIAVAAGVFIVAWNSRRFHTSGYLLVLGVAYLFVAALDLLHTLAYRGMGVFPGHGANLATQLWIATRYVEATALFAAPLFLRRRTNPCLLLAVGGVACSLLLVSIFYWQNFPDCFVEGLGLTAFKRVSEYVICLILIGAAALLTRRRAELPRDVFGLLVASIIVTIAAELAFTFYASAESLANLVGHYFKIISFYLIYRALIRTGLVRPYDLAFADLKRAEQALMSSQREMAAVTALSPVGLFRTDVDGDVIYANQTAKDMVGLSFSGIEGRGWLRAVHQDDREHLAATIEEAADTGRGFDSVQRFVHGNGRVVWTHLHTIPERTADGEITAYVGTLLDITERKDAEEELRQQRDFAEGMIDTVPMIVLVLDVDARIVRFNPYMEKISGYDLAEVKGKDWFTTFLPEQDRDHIRRVFTDATGEIDTSAIVNPIVTKTGVERMIEWSSTTLRGLDDSVVGVLSLGQDITQRTQAEEILRSRS